MELTCKLFILVVICAVKFANIQCIENVDVPLTNNLEAPLKASLDISLLNKEISALIQTEVKQAVKQAMEEVAADVTNRKLNETIEVLDSKFTDAVSEMRQNAVDKTTFDLKMQDLDNRIEKNQERVALTACTSSTSIFVTPVKFSRIMTKVGINNIASFQSTGKFTCEVPGLYYISAYLRSDFDDNAYYLKKNGAIISYSATIDWPGSSSRATTSINAVIEVQRNDELYIDADIHVEGTYSCITIVKIK